jgi:hypothetical protein
VCAENDGAQVGQNTLQIAVETVTIWLQYFPEEFWRPPGATRAGGDQSVKKSNKANRNKRIMTKENV